MTSFVPDVPPLLKNGGLATQSKNLKDRLLVIVGLAFFYFKVLAFASFVLVFYLQMICAFLPLCMFLLSGGCVGGRRLPDGVEGPSFASE